MVVSAEILVHRCPGVGETVLSIYIDPNVLLTASLCVVVPLRQVLDVLSIGTAPTGLLEHFPAVVVGRYPVFGVEMLHLVVPPSIYGGRVGISPHPMPCRPTVFRTGETPDTLRHRVHNVRMDIPALVKPRSSQLQGVQVGYVVCIIERTKHDLSFNITYLEVVGLRRSHVLAALPGWEPV